MLGLELLSHKEAYLIRLSNCSGINAIMPGIFFLFNSWQIVLTGVDIMVDIFIWQISLSVSLSDFRFGWHGCWRLIN